MNFSKKREFPGFPSVAEKPTLTSRVKKKPGVPV
jgi:hypothetical protein